MWQLTRQLFVSARKNYVVYQLKNYILEGVMLKMGNLQLPCHGYCYSCEKIILPRDGNTFICEKSCLYLLAVGKCVSHFRQQFLDTNYKE
jgi:hypothetical protein